MKKSHTLLAFVALALAVTVSLPGAWAYFTANVRAGGGRTVRLGDQTEITETFADWNKQITVAAQPDTQPVYVRARAYSAYPLEYSGEGWQQNADGWYYYNTPLAKPADDTQTAPAWTQETTSPLTVGIREVEVSRPGETPEDFDVVVVYEATLVRYNEAGEPYADWSRSMVLQNGGAAE